MELNKMNDEVNRRSNLRTWHHTEVAEFRVKNQCLIVKLKTDVDHHSAVDIKNETDKFIDQGYINNIIFDFSQVTFMDSSGIGILMGRYKRILFLGGKVVVTNVCDMIDRILYLSGMYKIIEKYPSIQEAMENF